MQPPDEIGQQAADHDGDAVKQDEDWSVTVMQELIKALAHTRLEDHDPTITAGQVVDAGSRAQVRLCIRFTSDPIDQLTGLSNE